MKNSAINRIVRDIGKVPLIGCLTTDSDWWVITGRITQHPWVDFSLDETPAELWVGMDGTSRVGIFCLNLNLLLNVLIENNSSSHVGNEHTYAAAADNYSVKHMCTKIHRHTAVSSTGHLIPVLRDSFTSLSLTAPCTATSIKQPPPPTHIYLTQ